MASHRIADIRLDRLVHVVVDNVAGPHVQRLEASTGITGVMDFLHRQANPLADALEREKKALKRDVRRVVLSGLRRMR